MDMDFKQGRKLPSTPTPGNASAPEEKALPGFRPSSELPENTSEDDAIVSAFTSPETDPTDLTLDREKQAAESGEQNSPERPFQQTKPPKKRAQKKHIIILLVLLVIVAVGAAAMLFLPKFLNKDDSVSVQEETTAQADNAKPSLVPAPITGIDVAEDIARRPVTAVMIENSVDARPQSGVAEADMVVEAIAEGGITRFVALFQSKSPESIGPIRSARPYYVDIAKTFDAAYVHAGGSPDALNRISELSVKDMSAFEDNGTYFRVDSRDAPHDLYSTMARIDTRRTELGFTTSTFTPWKHKEDTAQTPTASVIDFAISSPAFNPTFSYDAATNSYKRSINGAPDVDEKTQQQVNPKVVIGLITNRGQNGIYSEYQLTGSGDAKIFQDGIVTNGTWSKDAVTNQFVFKDKNGLEFVFNKGQVWMSLLDSASDINFAP